MPNTGVHANQFWPPCPYCGYRWPKIMDITFLTVRADHRLETVFQCPCKKSGIAIKFQLIEEKFLDIEGAKHMSGAEEKI
jgi:hypothetical protein